MIEDQDIWCRVSLRLSGDSLPVDEITPTLGLPATILARKGEFAGGKPGRAKHQTNLWVHDHTVDSAVPFADQLADLLGLLEKKRSSLLTLVSQPGNEAELFLGFSSTSGQGGAYFSAEMIGRIATLRLAINLDLYPPTEFEEGE